MKTLFKIVVILTLAVLVGGLFYGVVTAAFAGTTQFSTERPATGQLPANGEFSPPDRADGTGGIQFPVDAIKNLVIISIVSVIYLNAVRWLGRKKSAAQIVS